MSIHIMFYIDHLEQKQVSHRTASLPIKKKIEKPARKSKAMPIEVAMAITHRAFKGPNMSRKISGTRLYPFPSFDKCDSLLFIPTSIAALCNCGDMPALSKLLHSRASKDCRIQVDVLSDDDMSPDFYVKMQGIIVETHPDIILCVHSTKVIENQIIASAVIKFTASTAMHKSIARVKKDPTFDPLFSVEREQSLRHMILREDIPEHERVQFYALLDTDLDLVIHKKTEMVLTFNDTTKKLTRMSMKCRLTAIEVIPRQIGFAE